MLHQIAISHQLNLFLVPLCIFSTQLLSAQCTNGAQPECACSTAPVLCTVDELDNYVFSMSSYQHPEDGPSPICQSEPSSQTNNPTWFAFTAWCTNLTLRARPENCQQSQGAVGVQIAIYEDCTFTNEVACDVDIQDCNTGPKVLVMSGLTIGKVYYFMVDGCLGSYCEVTIDVVGVCGEEVIAPWTMPMTGETNPCVGFMETYTAQHLDGAALYHWFLDGVMISQSTATSLQMHWTNPGSYQLCIDASHDPCVPITDAPSPLCITVEVHETNAGILNVSPSPLCVNELATISSAGYLAEAENTQILLIADATGTIVQVINASTGSFTSADNGTFTVYAYNYITNTGTVPAIGTNINDLHCAQECCDLVSQSITFQGIEAEVSNIVCHNNGTEYDASDDTYTFDLLVIGQTPGTSWRSSDGTLDGTYGTILTCGPYLINSGWLDFDLHDYNTPTCSTSITIVPPSACSVCIQSVDAGTGSTINCIDTIAVLTGTSSEAGAYTWTGPGLFTSNALTVTVSDSGWYYLSIDFANQCTFTDSVYIDMDTETPLVDAGAGSTLNCLINIVPLSGTSLGAGTYTWTGPGAFISNMLTSAANEPGWYYLTAVYANQCTFIDSVFIDEDRVQPVAEAGSDQILYCNIPEVFIDGSASTGNHLQFEWTDVSGVVLAGQPGFFTSMAGIYTLQVTNTVNGCYATDQVVVTVDPNSLQGIIADVFPESCFGENNGVINVAGISGGIPPFTYTLNGLVTNTNGQFANLTPGEYTLMITDVEGCMIDTFFTILQGVDLQLEVIPGIELIVGHSGSIQAEVNVPVEDLSSIQWSPPGLLACDSCLITSITALDNTLFQLTVMHENGCFTTATLNVTVVPETEIYIPNVFSPNGDGYNDYFTLYANERVEMIMALTVFDRWGELIFQQQHFNPNDENAGWDGKFRGKEMLPSMFVYFFEVLKADGSKEIISGDVTLVR